jgi:hypothetical protein
MQHPKFHANSRWRMRSLAVGLYFVVACHAAWAMQFGTVAPSSLQAWKAFRTAQPFQAQVIGLTGNPGDAERTLIVSEPPPSLGLARIQELVGPSAAGCATRTWSVMSGGWVNDLVCTLKTTDAPRTAELLAQLQVEVYGSAEYAAAQHDRPQP